MQMFFSYYTINRHFSQKCALDFVQKYGRILFAKYNIYYMYNVNELAGAMNLLRNELCKHMNCYCVTLRCASHGLNKTTVSDVVHPIQCIADTLMSQRDNS